jgi:hypothetical protein
MNWLSSQPIRKVVDSGLILSTLAFLISCSVRPDEADRQHAVELDRVADVSCDEAGGWTNLFFSGDPAAADGSVAVFAEVTPGFPIEVVRRIDHNRDMGYTLRVASTAEEEVLEFSPTQLGQCATAELQLEGVAHPVRIQISTADEWVYGRIAEHRVGEFAIDGQSARIEVYPVSGEAISMNALESVEIYVSPEVIGPVRRISERMESGEVIFSHLVGGAFLLGETGLAVDSLSADSRRVYLSEVGDAAFPSRGFPAPEFVGTDLTGKDHRLSDYLGQVVILEFWSTECPFSESARLQSNQLAAALQAVGGTLIAMSRESDAEVLQAHLEGHPRTSAVVPVVKETWRRWNPETVTPLYYVIGSDGGVLMRERGARAVRLATGIAGVAIP